jgi:predicted RNase H-like HicB family nuclease
MTINIVIHKAEEGGYWSEVPSLPGCSSQGETLEEVKRNTLDAIHGCLECDRKELQNKIPSNARILALAV